uniref:Uncharacterized protein n=1 Tax=Arundo donax TaxID=35708 RepID=A0A0A9GR59_ARUDO
MSNEFNRFNRILNNTTGVCKFSTRIPCFAHKFAAPTSCSKCYNCWQIVAFPTHAVMLQI